MIRLVRAMNAKIDRAVDAILAKLDAICERESRKVDARPAPPRPR